MNKVKPFILLISIAIGIFSCQKNSSSVTPTHPEADTTYLRKSEISYAYDAAGNKSSDSSTEKWVYDNQRRPILIVGRSGSTYFDSTITTYSANQAVSDNWIVGSVLQTRGHKVFFYDSKGYLDSVRETTVNISPNNGSPDTTQSDYVTVYYNDANGHDTTNITYDVSAGRVKGATVFSFYTNNSLTGMKTYAWNGVETNSSSWLDGNILADTVWDYSNGSLLFTHSYEYSSVLSGGFYGYAGTKNLVSKVTQATPVFAGSLVIFTDSYTFDALNRVSTQKEQRSDQTGYYLYVYTYY
jgi:hypothetical protein